MTKIKEMEAAAAKLAPTLPDVLKPIVEEGPSITAEISAFASERPELYKTVIDAVKEADKPGIRPTVSEPKDPASCKYTEEGTMVHDMMLQIAASDRRLQSISDLEYTLTAADKEEIKAGIIAKYENKEFTAAEKEDFNKAVNLVDIPSTMKLTL